jgi:hypothetical protein
VSRTPSPPQVRAAVSRCLAPAIPQERPHVRTQAPRADRSARRTCNRLPDRWPSWRRENNSREGTGDQRVGPTATPDEWQIMLFGDQNPPDKRDLVEGKLVQLGMRTAELGTNVVFDSGGRTNDQRSAGSLAPSARVAKSSTCRFATRTNAGVSPIGSQLPPADSIGECNASVSREDSR